MLTNPETVVGLMQSHHMRLAHIIQSNTWQLIWTDGHPLPSVDCNVGEACALVLTSTRRLVTVNTGRPRGKYENDIYHLAERVPVEYGGTYVEYHP